MDLPDVIGVGIEQARSRLAEAGIAVVGEAVTAPPRRPLLEGEWRVVQLKQSGPGVVLVTALFPVLADKQTSEYLRD